MKDDKKTVLLHEIHFWKENKILPEHYCNYLIALYTQGDETQRPDHKNKETKKSFGWEAFFTFMSLAFIIAAALITYITAISFGMQTLIMSIFVIGLIVNWFYFNKKGLNTMLLYITAAFILLFYTVQVNKAFYENAANSLFWLLLVNCGLWLVIGIVRKKLFFTISGAVGLILVSLLIAM